MTTVLSEFKIHHTDKFPEAVQVTFQAEVLEHPDEDQARDLVPDKLHTLDVDHSTFKYVYEADREERDDDIEYKNYVYVKTYYLNKDLERIPDYEPPPSSDLGKTILELIGKLISIIDEIINMMCDLIRDTKDLVELGIIFLPVLPILYLVVFHIFKSIN